MTSWRELAVRMARLGLRADLLPEAGAIDYGRVRVSHGAGGHGKHGTTSVAPWTDSLSLEWLRRFERLVDAFERDLTRQTRQQAEAEDNYLAHLVEELRAAPDRPRAGRDTRIVERYEGWPVAAVALVERCSPKTVERAREQGRVSIAWGIPKPAPLTSREVPEP